MMRHLRQFFLRWLGTADIHVFIKLHRVAGYDLSVKTLCDLDGEFCFSDCCRSCYRNNFTHILKPLHTFEHFFDLIACHPDERRSSMRTGKRIDTVFKIADQCIDLSGFQMVSAFHC